MKHFFKEDITILDFVRKLATLPLAERKAILKLLKINVINVRSSDK